MSVKTGKAIAVCIGENKGKQKTETDSITIIPDRGIENDAHAERGGVHHGA